MCKQITLKVLYEEVKKFGGNEWDSLSDAQDAVVVVCRKYERDYIIHKRVKVDGQWVVDSRKAGNPLGKTEAELVRECISIFDELVKSHPSLKQVPVVWSQSANDKSSIDGGPNVCECGHLFRHHDNEDAHCDQCDCKQFVDDGVPF